jgi:excisionase family DNA binding protein
MKLIGTREAAELLDLSDRHVRRLVDSGRLVASYVSPKIVLIDRREVEREIARRAEVSGAA